MFLLSTVVFPFCPGVLLSPKRFEFVPVTVVLPKSAEFTDELLRTELLNPALLAAFTLLFTPTFALLLLFAAHPAAVLAFIRYRFLFYIIRQLHPLVRSYFIISAVGFLGG